MVTRIYKINKNIKDYENRMSEIVNLRKDFNEKLKILVMGLGYARANIDYFKEMSDDELDKTKYRKEEFRVI